MENKKCPTCQLVKPIDEYYFKNKEKGIRLSECKECKKMRSIQWQKNNWEHHKEYKKKLYWKNPELSRMRNRFYSLFSTLSDEQKAEIRKRNKDWKQKNPEKKRAHRILSEAVKRNQIKRPNKCSFCGKKGKIIAHHYLEYKKGNELKVKWMCASCHRKIHLSIALKSITEDENGTIIYQD